VVVLIGRIICQARRHAKTRTTPCIKKSKKPRKDVPENGGQRAIGADNHEKICRRFCCAAFILRVRPFLKRHRRLLGATK